MPAPMAAPRAGELDAETTVAAAPATVSDSFDRGQGAVVARGGGAPRAWMPEPTAAPRPGELDAETAVAAASATPRSPTLATAARALSCTNNLRPRTN